MTDLPPDLAEVYRGLDEPSRRYVDQMSRRLPGRARRYLECRAAAIDAERQAVQAAPVIPGLTQCQAAFVASLDPDRKARLDALPAVDRADILGPLAHALDPILVELGRDLLRNDRPPPAEVRPRGGIRRVGDPAVNRRR